jgi:hypothetical protein
MQPQEELTLPLRLLLWRAVLRSLTFAGPTDRWSHLSTIERAERRANWPAWRRAVRPVGLGAFWFRAIWFVALGESSSPIAAVLRFGSVLLLLAAAFIGVRDWLRDVPPKRASTATAAGHSDPVASGSTLPDATSEHPTA